MNYKIKIERGYYALYVNGKFYGSYDTYKEAEDDLEILKKGSAA